MDINAFADFIRGRAVADVVGQFHLSADGKVDRHLTRLWLILDRSETSYMVETLGAGRLAFLLASPNLQDIDMGERWHHQGDCHL